MHELENGDRSWKAYRFIIGSFFLAVAVGVAMILLVAVQAIEPSRVFGNFPHTRNIFSSINGLGWMSRLGIAAVAGIVGMLSIVIILRLFSRPTPSATFYIVDADDRGIVVVDSRGISTVAAQAAMSAHGVVDVQVSAKGTGASPVVLSVDAAVYPGANIKRSCNDVREAVREAVESMVGISVGEVSVRAHVIDSDAIASLIK